MTPEQRDGYAKNGYLVVRGLFAADEIAPWLERLAELLGGDAPTPPGMLVMRDVMVARGAVAPDSRAKAIAKIQDFENDAVLWSYVEHPRLLDRVEEFIGADVASIHTMLINKPPDVDGRHPLHQDLLYFPFRPAERIVATWTALERCTRENGCLAVVPGTHHGELLRHENPDWEFVNGGYFGASSWSQ